MKQKESWMLSSGKAGLLALTAVAAVFTFGLTFSSCSDDDDNQVVEPMLQKKVRQVTTYRIDDDGYYKKSTDQYTYDAQGRLIQWKYYAKNNGEDWLLKSYELKYSEQIINVISKAYPVNSDSKVVVSDTDYKLDGKGRIVSGIAYSYFEGDSRNESPEQQESEYYYDEQGRLSSYKFEDVDFVLEWQGTELHKMSRYVDGSLISTITYEPSNLLVGNMMPYNPANNTELLMHLGYLGSRSRFLTARTVQEFYIAQGTITSSLALSFDYEQTFGLVNAYSTVEDLYVDLIQNHSILNYKSAIVWE